MKPTPDLSHIPEETFLQVYEPAGFLSIMSTANGLIEDTFILLDALEHDIPYLRQLFSGKSSLPIVIEIGSGSGCVSAFLQKEIILPYECLLFSLDISVHANLTTASTLEKNIPRQFNSVIQCDLLNGLRVNGGVDVLVFNPPYVPTEEDDSWAGNIGFAWKGGGMGMQTTWRVLNRLEDILSPDGVFYLVAVELNKPMNIIETMKNRGMNGEVSHLTMKLTKVILKRKAGREVLYVLRFTRSQVSQ